MALSLNNTVVARIAAALYGQQLGSASMTEALSEVSNLGSVEAWANQLWSCLLYTSPSPRDRQKSRMPSSA